MIRFLFSRTKDKGVDVKAEIDSSTIDEMAEKALLAGREEYEAKCLSSLRGQIKEKLYNKYGIGDDDLYMMMHDYSRRERRLLEAIIDDMITELDMLADK